MSGELKVLPEIVAPAPKKRGRKPGCEKPPGSGRKPGSKNKVSADLRQTILARGKPVELLADICRGVKIRVGPPAGPGEPQYVYPTLQERASAAKILLDKIMVPPPAGAPPEPGNPAEEISDFDAAMRLSFLLSRAAKEARPGKPVPRTMEGLRAAINGEPVPDEPAAPAADMRADIEAAQAERARVLAESRRANEEAEAAEQARREARPWQRTSMPTPRPQVITKRN